MTDTEKKPIDNSKDELTEAELDQVAGGVYGVIEAARTKQTPHEKIPQPAAGRRDGAT
jgi:hypothetical protein